MRAAALSFAVLLISAGASYVQAADMQAQAGRKMLAAELNLTAILGGMPPGLSLDTKMMEDFAKVCAGTMQPSVIEDMIKKLLSSMQLDPAMNMTSMNIGDMIKGICASMVMGSNMTMPTMTMPVPGSDPLAQAVVAAFKASNQTAPPQLVSALPGIREVCADTTKASAVADMLKNSTLTMSMQAAQVDVLKILNVSALISSLCDGYQAPQDGTMVHTMVNTMAPHNETWQLGCNKTQAMALSACSFYNTTAFNDTAYGKRDLKLEDLLQQNAEGICASTTCRAAIESSGCLPLEILALVSGTCNCSTALTAAQPTCSLAKVMQSFASLNMNDIAAFTDPKFMTSPAYQVLSSATDLMCPAANGTESSCMAAMKAEPKCALVMSEDMMGGMVKGPCCMAGLLKDAKCAPVMMNYTSLADPAKAAAMGERYSKAAQTLMSPMDAANMTRALSALGVRTMGDFIMMPVTMPCKLGFPTGVTQDVKMCMSKMSCLETPSGPSDGKAEPSIVDQCEVWQAPCVGETISTCMPGRAAVLGQAVNLAATLPSGRKLLQGGDGISKLLGALSFSSALPKNMLEGLKGTLAPFAELVNPMCSSQCKAKIAACPVFKSDSVLNGTITPFATAATPEVCEIFAGFAPAKPPANATGNSFKAVSMNITLADIAINEFKDSFRSQLIYDLAVAAVVPLSHVELGKAMAGSVKIESWILFRDANTSAVDAKAAAFQNKVQTDISKVLTSPDYGNATVSNVVPQVITSLDSWNEKVAVINGTTPKPAPKPAGSGASSLLAGASSVLTAFAVAFALA